MAPRISYVPVESMDERMQEEMQRCAREGTPRPESSAVRAHAPNAFWAFADSWQAIFHSGVLDHSVKELARVYVSRTVKCEFCGNQRSIKATTAGLLEQQYDELLNFESSDRYDERQKAALAYTEAICWRLDTDDAFWERMNAHFSEAELVELGCFVGLTFGQQSWLRMLDIEHHQVLAGTSASMAPGFETAEALAQSKAAETYWARSATGQPASTGA
jgi:AhpD family alkylhydroperoxidase